MRRLLKALTVSLVLLFAIPMGPAQAENIDHGYFVNIFTKGSIWGLRNNDLFVRENTDVNYATYVTDISSVTRNGDNTMSLLLTPMTGYVEATDTIEYALSKNVFVEIAIERVDFKTQGREVIHSIAIEYDEETGRFRSIPTTSSGFDRVFTTPNMQTDGKFRVTEMPLGDLIFSSGQTAAGYRIDFDFSVSSTEIPAFAWEQEATPLRDTPELRKELSGAYTALHNLISASDSEGIFEAAKPVWDRSAFLHTTRMDARSFVEGRDGNGLTGQYRVNRADGSVLQPLHFWEGPETAALQFMADSHLVRFRPDPIAWENPAGGNLSYHQFPVVFYRTQAGEWKIGAITTGQ